MSIGQPPGLSLTTNFLKIRLDAFIDDYNDVVAMDMEDPAFRTKFRTFTNDYVDFPLHSNGVILNHDRFRKGTKYIIRTELLKRQASVDPNSVVAEVNPNHGDYDGAISARLVWEREGLETLRQHVTYFFKGTRVKKMLSSALEAVVPIPPREDQKLKIFVNEAKYEGIQQASSSTGPRGHVQNGEGRPEISEQDGEDDEDGKDGEDKEEEEDEEEEREKEDEQDDQDDEDHPDSPVPTGVQQPSITAFSGQQYSPYSSQHSAGQAQPQGTASRSLTRYAPLAPSLLQQKISRSPSPPPLAPHWHHEDGCGSDDGTAGQDAALGRAGRVEEAADKSVGVACDGIVLNHLAKRRLSGLEPLIYDYI